VRHAAVDAHPVFTKGSGDAASTWTSPPVPAQSYEEDIDGGLGRRVHARHSHQPRGQAGQPSGEITDDSGALAPGGATFTAPLTAVQREGGVSETTGRPRGVVRRHKDREKEDRDGLRGLAAHQGLHAGVVDSKAIADQWRRGSHAFPGSEGGANSAAAGRG